MNDNVRRYIPRVFDVKTQHTKRNARVTIQVESLGETNVHTITDTNRVCEEILDGDVESYERVEPDRTPLGPGNMFAAIREYPSGYPSDSIAQDFGMTVEEVERIRQSIETAEYKPGVNDVQRAMGMTRVDPSKAPQEWNFELAQGHAHMTRGFNNQDHFETLVWLGLALSRIKELELRADGLTPESISEVTSTTFTGWTPDLQKLTRELVGAIDYESNHVDVRLYSAQEPFDKLAKALGHISATDPQTGEHVEAEDRGGSARFGQMAEDAEKEYARRVGVHMSHCYQGEWEDHCKYGDDDCPAKKDTREPGPNPYPLADQLLWTCGICHSLLPGDHPSVEKHYQWHRSQ